MERPKHRSAAPVDATAWSMRYLQRQEVKSQPWFRHLDFAKLADEDIKKTFWTGFLEEKFKKYIPIPLAMRRDPQIRSHC